MNASPSTIEWGPVIAVPQAGGGHENSDILALMKRAMFSSKTKTSAKNSLSKGKATGLIEDKPIETSGPNTAIVQKTTDQEDGGECV